VVNFEFDTVFVGGAPRSGTTLLHALICTGQRVNDFVAECTYLTNLMTTHRDSVALFDVHGKYYFNDIDDLDRFHAGIVEKFVRRTWERLGRPEILSLKSPILTYYFHDLAKMIPSAKFVISVRNSRDAVLSRVEVERRRNNTVTEQDVFNACAEYNAIYTNILDHKDAFSDRILYVAYSRLVRGNVEHDRISAFVDQVNPQEIWHSSITDIRNHKDNEWATDLLGEQISQASDERYRSVLDDAMLDRISDLCGNVEQRLLAEMHEIDTRAPCASALLERDEFSLARDEFSLARDARGVPPNGR
jgi:hypothetical protein